MTTADDNIDLVRRGFEAFNARDFDTALAGLREDVTWERFLSRAETDTPVVRGKDELRAVWESQVQAVDIRVEVEEFISAGENRVIAPSRMVARGSGSEITLSEEVTWVIAFDASGLIASVEVSESQEAVEIVRWLYEKSHAQRRVDLPGIETRVAPDYRFYARPGFPGRPSYRMDEMPALWADLDTTFSDYSLVPEHYETLGSYVLVTLRQAARMRGSEQRINSLVYHLWFLSDGMVQETWTFGTESEAREAVGQPGEDD